MLRDGAKSGPPKLKSREPTAKFVTAGPPPREPTHPFLLARPANDDVVIPLARAVEPVPLPLAQRIERDETPTVAPDPILLAAASPFVHESPDEDLLAPYRVSPLRFIAKVWRR